MTSFLHHIYLKLLLTISHADKGKLHKNMHQALEYGYI